MTDELQAALARAEAAEAKVEEMKVTCRSIGDEYGNFTCPGADVLADMKRQRDEARVKSAEAMREKCSMFLDGRGYHLYADLIRSFPIPTQEVK